MHLIKFGFKKTMERVGSIKSDNYTRENNFRMYTDLIAHACLCVVPVTVCVCVFLVTCVYIRVNHGVHACEYNKIHRTIQRGYCLQEGRRISVLTAGCRLHRLPSPMVTGPRPLECWAAWHSGVACTVA